jgi:hypothetical protein
VYPGNANALHPARKAWLGYFCYAEPNTCFHYSQHRGLSS